MGQSFRRLVQERGDSMPKLKVLEQSCGVFVKNRKQTQVAGTAVRGGEGDGGGSHSQALGMEGI